MCLKVCPQKERLLGRLNLIDNGNNLYFIVEKKIEEILLSDLNKTSFNGQ